MRKNTIQALIGILFCIFIMMGAFWFITYPYFHTETIIVKGKIINVETIIDENNNIEYFNITFDDNSSYEISSYGIHYNKEIDFTINSNIILELHKSKYPFGIENYDTRHWVINHIIKIP